MTQDLVEWLLEQLADDEAAARRCPGADFAIAEHPSRPGLFEIEAYAPGQGDSFDDVVVAEGGWRGIPEPYAQHIERWDPARVQAECDAKRQIVEWCMEVIGDRDLSTSGQAGALADVPDAMAVTLAVETLRLQAEPYAKAGRPGYREEWRPSDTPG